MRKKIGVVLLLCLLTLVGCSQGKSSKQQVSSIQTTTSSAPTATEKSIVNTEIPTLFIHGYKGNRNSFGGMIHRFNSQGYGDVVTVCYVSPEGVVTEERSDKSVPPQLIQIIFEDNENNEWNQADWILACLKYLMDEYQIMTVNLVGHSMGGVSSLRYLTAYGANGNLPQVKKLVAIGAPFNQFEEAVDSASIKDVEENGPNIQTDRYLEYANHIGNYPVTTNFLNIVGDIMDGSVSDGTVPVVSGLSVDSLLRGHGVSVSYQVIEGSGAQHSKLHENTEVDELIADFLWKS